MTIRFTPATRLTYTKEETMSTTSDYNMLRLEAHRGLLQITNDEESQEEALEIANPVGWM